MSEAKRGELAKAKGSAFRRIGWREAERILRARVKNRRLAFYFCDDPKMMEYLCGGPRRGVGCRDWLDLFLLCLTKT